MNKLRAVVLLVVGLAALVPFGSAAYPLGPTYCVDAGVEQHLGTLQPTFTHDGVTYNTVIVIDLNLDPDEDLGPRTNFIVTAVFDYTYEDTSSSFMLETLLGSPEPDRWEIRLSDFVLSGTVIDAATVSAEAPICITIRYAASLLSSLSENLGDFIDNGEIPPAYAGRLPTFVSVAERMMQMGRFEQSIKHLERFIVHVDRGVARQEISPNVGENLIFDAQMAIEELSAPNSGNQEPIN